ncbi:hypothetical protein ACIBEJ_09850 [Nonomuraea sp. NPDC050790]|uniref:hypothetical protein n=1 Tax=Nonomuraea sp. NPDC050790 TaxID=3364371 RepID=UPI0037BC5B8F
MRRVTGTLLATAVITVSSWAAPPVDAHAADAYCDAAAAGRQARADLSQGLLSGDPAQMTSALEQAKAATRTILSAAPADIKPAWQAQLDGLEALEKAITDAIQSQGDPAKLQKIQQTLEAARQKFTTSSTQGEADLAKRCP